MKSKIVTFVSFLFVFIGCSSRSTYESTSEYGVRWIDYDELGKIELGMDKQNVTNILGEPFMTSEASFSNGKKYQTLNFKFRVKLYVNKKIDITKPLGNDSKKSMISSAEIKPDKYAVTSVWGEYYDLNLIFENNILIKWISPQFFMGNSPQKDSEKISTTP